MARRRPTLDRDRGFLACMTGTVFLLGLVYVIFFVVLLQGVGMALPVVIVLAGGLLVVQYWTSDKIALASAGARIVDESQAPELHAIVQRLCLTAGLPMPRIAICPTDMPNAFATGRSPKHAAVAVTQGLLDRPHRRLVELGVSYVGFTAAERFCVGYGLAHHQRFRNLPDIRFLA